VSESTRRDVIDLLSVPPERVSTVLEAAGSIFQTIVGRNAARTHVRDMGIRDPYLLTVGTLEPRKNYSRLFEAYALLRQRGVEKRLVVAGRRGWMYEPALRSLAGLGLESDVTIVQPSDQQLAALYMCADVFVYPSLYEGFGIPLLEALSCGIPVACSNSSSMPEVVGDAAVLFDPLDVTAIADAISSILNDPGLHSALCKRGPWRAALFSWDTAAEKTLQVYREAAGA
jgi:glycosyltransferase involved in cell wall biosynthesis